MIFCDIGTTSKLQDDFSPFILIAENVRRFSAKQTFHHLIKPHFSLQSRHILALLLPLPTEYYFL